jgi:hypothetical protein
MRRQPDAQKRNHFEKEPRAKFQETNFANLSIWNLLHGSWIRDAFVFLNCLKSSQRRHGQRAKPIPWKRSGRLAG